MEDWKIFAIILTAYLFNTALFLYSVILPYMLVVKTFEFYYGFYFLIFGGWFGFVFICISMKFLHRGIFVKSKNKRGFNMRLAAYFGFLGSGLLILNLLIILYIGDRLGTLYILLPGYFIFLLSTLIYLNINILISILIKINIIGDIIK